MSKDALINVTLGKEGIIRAWSEVSTVVDGKLSAEAFDVASLGLRLTHDALREHFAGKSSSDAQPLPIGEHDIFRCACSELFMNADDAIRHVEKDHANARIRRDIDKLEDTIEGLVTPNPLPPAPEPTVVIKDRTFRDELITELTDVFKELKLGDERNAIELVELCGWDKVAGINLAEVKLKILNKEDGPKIPKPLHEFFLTAIALFLRQVVRLSKYGEKV